MARRSRLRLWLGALAGVVLLLACAVLGVAWFAGTEEALRWLASRAQAASGGRLALDEVRGSLYGSIRIGRFAFESGGDRVEGRKLSLEWSPRELLFRRTLLVRTVSLQSLSLSSGGSSAAPPRLPETLRLPLHVDVRSVTIDAMSLAVAGARHEFRALTLRAGSADDRLHAVASVKTPWGRSEAELTVADKAPFALSGNISLDGDDGRHAYSMKSELSGTIEDLLVAAAGSYGGIRVDLHAEVAPLRSLPLKQAALRLAGVDARKFAAAMPRTDIGAQLDLRARSTGGYAGELRLVNGLPGAIDATRLPLREARLSFAGTPETLELNDVRFDLGDAGRFSGAGRLLDGRLKLALDTSALDLRGVYGKLIATKLAGSVRLDAQSANQDIEVDLGEGAYRVRIDASRRAEAVDVRSAMVSIAGGELMFSGTMSLAQARAFRAEGTLARFDPSRVGDYPGALINGRVSVSGHLSPTLEAALEFSTADSRYRGHRLHGGGKARVSPQRVWDGDIALELGANRLSARGAFGAAGDGLEWSLEARDLTVLAAQWAGSLSASGTLGGRIDEPSGSFRARGRNLVWAGEHRVGEFAAEARIDDGIDGPVALGATLRDYKSASVRLDTASVEAKGRRSEHALKLTARNADFDANAALAGGWGAGKGWSGRILRLENLGRYALTLESPASLALSGAEFSLGGANLRLAGGKVRIDELARRGGGLYASGSLTAIESKELLKLIDRPLGVSSTVTLGGSWRLAAAEAVNGEFRLQRERGDLTLHSEPPTAMGLSRLAVSAAISDNRLSAKLEAMGDKLGTMTADARTMLARQGGSVGLPGSADLSIDAQLALPSLAWVTPLTGGRMIIDGSLNGRIGARGTVAKPRLQGRLSGDGIKFEFPEQGIYLKDGLLRANLNEDTLTLDRLELRAGDGGAEGSGTIAWASDRPQAQIALKANKLELVKRLDRHLILSGNASIAARDGRLQATAALKADKGEIELPKGDAPTLSDDVVVLGRDTQSPERSAPMATLLELDLDLGEQFHLKGRGIDASLAGGVKLRAATGSPAVATGSIRVAKGNFTAYGQRLTIDRGILNFIGPLDNPGLDIVALRKQLPVEAGVAVRGTALAPVINLVSNPAVPDSDKLSWLILGRGSDGASGKDLALLQAAAGALLARGDSVLLQDRIAKAAGLDEVALAGSGGLESTVLTLGKRISSRAYLSFEQGLAAATHLVKINYTLTPRISVRAQTGTESAVDAFYTFSFH